MQTYQAGHIKLTNASDIVEGFGTAWNNYSRAGDTLIVGNNTYLIAEVMDNHLMRLSAPYAGESVNGVKYLIERQPVVETLAELRARIEREVDAIAGETRLRFVSVSPGQEMTYTAKLEDARAYIAAGYPADASPFIWINAEAEATGATPTQVADLIVYTAGVWSTIGAQIEGHRQATKQIITNSDESQTLAALATFRTVMAAL